MRLLLVDNLILPQEGSLASLDVHPHLGLVALATVAEGAGHTVAIYDPKRLIRGGELQYDETLYERVAAELLAWRPDAVGFTSLGCSFLFALNVAAFLKQRDAELPVLLGGPHATMLHRQIMERFPQFDVIARHECDQIFPEVLDNLERRRFDHIEGMSWRTPAGLHFTDGKPIVKDLDSLPIGSYDYYPVAGLGLPLLRIEAGRGCPFHCTFCSTAGFFQRSFRLKSAERLVHELDLLHARYGVSDFKLDHDMFTVNRRKVIEFCQHVAGRGYRWRASARVDCVDDELLEIMAASGCVGLYFGIETGSARLQEICQKRLDLDLVLPVLAAADRLGIETTASFITGYPEENEQDQDDTLDLMGRCASPSCLTQLHILAPEPGTPMFDQHRHELAYDGYGGPYNTELVGPDDQTLVLQHPDIFQTYHYYPAAMPRSRYVFAVEMAALLRRVGPIVLGYVLRAYDGRLSMLVRDIERFADEPVPDAKYRSPEESVRRLRAAIGRMRGAATRRCRDIVEERQRSRRTVAAARPGHFLPGSGTKLLEAYVSATFGPDHPLVSLFRYALCVHEGGSERVLPSRPEPLDFDPEVPYSLGANVRILADMHDCSLLLGRIVAGSTLADVQERDSVYVVTPSGSYRTATGVEVILELFEQPRSCREVREATGMSGSEDAFFEDLVRAGILTASAETARLGAAQA